ncbi:hypothetical protein EYF80_006194 [Liparis tanakae]|uniref:Uncharacterized protein n=1 Tax=Liparis tanakae TaxID=230148 RepID=A0A4Z2J0H7_9TELE|nr:hypothetical protein EYF80_006194 [Liparis tanakae]
MYKKHLQLRGGWRFTPVPPPFGNPDNELYWNVSDTGRITPLRSHSAQLTEPRCRQPPSSPEFGSEQTHTQINNTHRHSGDGGDEGVDEDGRRLAVVLRSRVGLGVGFVEAEEALDVHGERVRVLKVVRQQNGACHDDQLEIKHIGSSFRIVSAGEEVREEKTAGEEKLYCNPLSETSERQMSRLMEESGRAQMGET